MTEKMNQRQIRSKSERSDRAKRLHQKQIDLAVYLEQCAKRETESKGSK